MVCRIFAAGIFNVGNLITGNFPIQKNSLGLENCSISFCFWKLGQVRIETSVNCPVGLETSRNRPAGLETSRNCPTGLKKSRNHPAELGREVS